MSQHRLVWLQQRCKAAKIYPKIYHKIYHKGIQSNKAIIRIIFHKNYRVSAWYVIQI